MSDEEYLDPFDNIDLDAIPEEQAKLIEIIQQMFQRLHELEKQTDEADDVSSDFLYAVYDQRKKIQGRGRKWYPNRRTMKEGICFHHTAVKGGFGVHKKTKRKYLEMDRHWNDWLIQPSNDISHDEWARAMALGCRYRGWPAGQYNKGVPYHAIMGPNSVLYLNLPFDWVTWHGNGSNKRFLGVGWDANSTKEDFRAEDLIRDAKEIIRIGREEGHPLDHFTAHCAWTNKRYDPGKAFIEQVMVPVSEQMGVTMDWDHKVNKRGARSMREVVERG
jgi:hypothetical protein